jgi:hypothetical protein
MALNDAGQQCIDRARLSIIAFDFDIVSASIIYPRTLELDTVSNNQVCHTILWRKIIKRAIFSRQRYSKGLGQVARGNTSRISTRKGNRNFRPSTQRAYS